MTGSVLAPWKPETGDIFIHCHPEFGDRCWVLRKRAKHPDDGTKCLQVASQYLPLAECRPLGWTPRPGLRVQVIAQWSRRYGKQGTITRLKTLEGMPLVDVRIEGERSLFEAQLNWLQPVGA